MAKYKLCDLAASEVDSISHRQSEYSTRLNLVQDTTMMNYGIVEQKNIMQANAKLEKFIDNFDMVDLPSKTSKLPTQPGETSFQMKMRKRRELL